MASPSGRISWLPRTLKTVERGLQAAEAEAVEGLRPTLSALWGAGHLPTTFSRILSEVRDGMYELKVTVKKVMGECTANPPMKPGDYFTVKDGDIQVPEGGYICAWALQSLIPVLTPKEREISEDKDADWMWRVHHAQCPDPAGRVVFKIERVATLDPGEEKGHRGKGEAVGPDPEAEAAARQEGTSENGLVNLRIHVESVTGKCTSRQKPGTSFTLRSGRLYIPPGEHACLYALHSVLPFVAAKQRSLEDGDWLKEDNRILCPDPAGNVILRVERMEKDRDSL